MIDEIVAKVNDETITFTDLQSELAVLKAGLQAQIEDPQDRAQRFELQRRGMLRGMIQSRLMMQKAEELGMGANADVQVSAYLEYVRKESGIPNMEVFDQVLRRQGSSMLELRRRTREKVIGETLVSQMVYSRLTVMTQEVEEFYESNIKLFTEPAEVELAEILFLIEGKDKAQVHSKAEDVLNTLEAGAAFEDLAKEFSEGATASSGGGIGSFKQGSLSEALEKVVFKIEEGTSSDIIEAGYGYQIVKVLSRKAARKKTLDEVRPQIMNAIQAKKGQPEIQKFLENLRRESFIYVAPEYRKQFDVEGLGKPQPTESEPEA